MPVEPVNPPAGFAPYTPTPETQALTAATGLLAALPRTADPVEMFGVLAHTYAHQFRVVCTAVLTTPGQQPVTFTARPDTARPDTALPAAAPLDPAARPPGAPDADAVAVWIAQVATTGSGEVMTGSDWAAIPIPTPQEPGADPDFPSGAVICWHPDGKADWHQQVLQLLLLQAVRALQTESDLARARADTQHLQTALLSNRDIGTAMGILMISRLVTADGAFTLLRELSQITHRKLRDVAADVIHTGALPPGPPTTPTTRSRTGR